MLTDDQKHEFICEIVGIQQRQYTGLTFRFIDGLPGYVVLISPPDIITGTQTFRCINHEMRNFLADTLEECVQKARDYAAKHEAAKCK